MSRPAAAIFSLFAALGCSSSGGSGTPPADSGIDPCATSADYLDRATACRCYVKSLTDKATALMCTLSPDPVCPDVLLDFERNNGVVGKCMRYKVSALLDCRNTINAYAGCGDFSTKPCVLAIQEDPTGKACPAGSDAGTDASDATPVDVHDATPIDAPASSDAPAGG